MDTERDTEIQTEMQTRRQPMAMIQREMGRQREKQSYRLRDRQ